MEVTHVSLVEEYKRRLPDGASYKEVTDPEQAARLRQQHNEGLAQRLWLAYQ